MHFLIFTVMLIRKVALFTATISPMLDFKPKVCSLPSIFPLSVNICSLRHAILARNRWVLKIKMKICRRRDVLGWLYIVGQTLPTVILSKLAFLKMWGQTRREFWDLVINSMTLHFIRNWAEKCLSVFLLFLVRINLLMRCVVSVQTMLLV